MIEKDIQVVIKFMQMFFKIEDDISINFAKAISFLTKNRTYELSLALAFQRIIVADKGKTFLYLINNGTNRDIVDGEKAKELFLWINKNLMLEDAIELDMILEEEEIYFKEDDDLDTYIKIAHEERDVEKRCKAIIALGQSKNESVLEILIKLSKNESSIIREAVMRSFYCIKSSKSKKVLKISAVSDSAKQVRLEAISSLSQYVDDDIYFLLCKIFNSAQDSHTLQVVCTSLSFFGEKALSFVFNKLVAKQKKEVRLKYNTYRSLFNSNNYQISISFLSKKLAMKDSVNRELAVGFLSFYTYSKQAKELIKKSLKDESEHVRKIAEKSLQFFKVEL
ncbi:MAG: HEAT repeat domain-containing protein [Bacteroidota bacterium]